MGAQSPRLPGDRPTSLGLVFERFSDRARRVLVLAQEEARLLQHTFIGTEHILLGLIGENDGIGAEALRHFGISLEAARAKVEEIINQSGGPSAGSPPFTPRAKKVLELALRESLQLGHSWIGTEHLLLGLVREGEGVACAVLVDFGADLGRVRQEVIRLVSGRESGGEPSVRGGVVEVGSFGEWTRTRDGWAAPVWDRPSEGTVPHVVAVNALLLRSDLTVIAVDHLQVYPNGLTICLDVRVNPLRAGELLELLRPRGQSQWPRVRVRFADGRTGDSELGSTHGLPKGEDGIPTSPVVSLNNVWGGPNGRQIWAWIFPLPTDGPLEISLSLEAAGLEEATVTIDGATLRAAAGQAQVIWE